MSLSFFQPLGLLNVEQESCLTRTDKMKAKDIADDGRALCKGCHPEHRLRALF